MGMTAQLWTISALAVELDRDRRTVAKALRKVKPDGKVGRANAWHLETALSALQPAESDESNAKARHAAAQARLAELQLERMEGRSVDRAEAERVIFRRARTERDSWNAWAVKSAAALSAELEVPERTLYPVLAGMVRAHLEELASTPFESLTDA